MRYKVSSFYYSYNYKKLYPNPVIGKNTYGTLKRKWRAGGRKGSLQRFGNYLYQMFDLVVTRQTVLAGYMV